MESYLGGKCIYFLAEIGTRGERGTQRNKKERTIKKYISKKKTKKKDKTRERMKGKGEITNTVRFML